MPKEKEDRYQLRPSNFFTFKVYRAVKFSEDTFKPSLMHSTQSHIALASSQNLGLFILLCRFIPTEENFILLRINQDAIPVGEIPRE